MRNVFAAFVFGAAFAASGCATGGSPHDLVLSSVGSARSMRVEDDRVVGPNIEIDRFADGYRGTFLGRVVDLRVGDDGRVRGAIDSQPVDLHVSEEGDTLALRGLVGGLLGHVELSPDRLSGLVGRCGYDLARVSGTRAYRGYRCGANDAVLRIPENWEARVATQRAVLLALLLSAT